MPQSPSSLLRAEKDQADLERVARRLFWWLLPKEALANPIRFAAQVMTYGTWDDVQTAKKELGEDIFRKVLAHPPAGVFDQRSWVYWHRYFGVEPIPPLPKCSPPGVNRFRANFYGLGSVGVWARMSEFLWQVERPNTQSLDVDSRL